MEIARPIAQGDVFWFDFGPYRGSDPAGRRPAVVAQSDRFNRSQIGTTVIAVITSNLRLQGIPGNIRLAKGEAGLLHPSVINVTQLRTVEKAALVKRIGQLSRDRIEALREGLALVFETH